MGRPARRGAGRDTGFAKCRWRSATRTCSPKRWSYWKPKWVATYCAIGCRCPGPSGPKDTIPVTGYFNLVHVWNTEAAFGFLADAGGWQRYFFIVLAIAVSAVFVWMLRRSLPIGEAVGLSVIIGGALQCARPHGARTRRRHARFSLAWLALAGIQRGGYRDYLGCCAADRRQHVCRLLFSRSAPLRVAAQCATPCARPCC